MQGTFLGYSDQEDHQLLCYPLEEVLVEKLRSVMQRMQARDFYDIWYLLEIHEMDVAFYSTEFRSKCASKEIDPTDFHNGLAKKRGDFGDENCLPPLNLIQSTKLHLTTEPPIFCRCC